MIGGAANREKIMKPVRNAETDGEERSRARSKEDERTEALVMLAIAILLVANVVLYLCHH
jgi:hypothetical protein